MTDFSTTTIKAIKPFRSANTQVVFVPPSRFFIFGEGKDGKHRGLVIEGRIADKVDKRSVYDFDGKTLTPATSQYDPERKLEFFDALYDGIKPVINFVMPIDILRRLLKFARDNKSTHVRIYQRDDGVTKARTFDARKYFDELIRETKRAEVIGEEVLQANVTLPFHIYLKVSTLKLLPKEDFSVTVYDNGLVDFDGLKSDVCCHMRDQRLGERFEETLTRLRGVENVLAFDPRRATAVRRKMNQKR